MKKRAFIPIRKCRICKKSFQPKMKSSIMCSERCRSKHKRDWHDERYSEFRKFRVANAERKECKKCKKEFAAVPTTRIFCSRSCSKSYLQAGKIIKNPAQYYKKHPYRDYTISRCLDTLEKKKEHRKELLVATEKFLKEGGEVKKLIDIPGPKLPTVGSRYWDWETTVGLDPLGTENYSEPDCVVEDIILTLNK